ncbi:MAG: hypothetical protein MI919_31180, partial [Holophagales bacterium]|nr:hypothetical protein [Holophagales bacterium]
MRRPGQASPSSERRGPLRAPEWDPRRARRTRRILRLGAVAALLPLVLLLWLQYRWLQDLERASTIARRAELENYLRVIAKEVKLTYHDAAQRVLDLPGPVLETRHASKVAAFFDLRKVELARRLFVVSFFTPDGPTVHFFDEESRSLYVPDDTAELAAVRMAVAPWQVQREKGDAIGDMPVLIEARDRRHPMVLDTLTDGESRLVGMVGMILDEDHFRRVVLPDAIDRTLAGLADTEQLKVSVRDGDGQWVLGEPIPRQVDSRDGFLSASHSLSFVFRDWRIYLSGPSSPPGEWARANFAANLSLTLVLSVL